MTTRQLSRWVMVLVILGVVLGLGAVQQSDPETRQTYLLTVVVLYTLALVVWVLVMILIRVLPHVDGLVERHLKQETLPPYVPDELNSLLQAVKTGRRSARRFETELKPWLRALERADALTTESAPPSRLEAFLIRFRRGPSIKRLEAMLEKIEEM